MLSKIFFSLLAAGSALAAPGGGWGDNGQECYTTCSTELCTQSTVYQKTTEVYETKTMYQPVTNYYPSTYAYTKTYTTSSASKVVTQKPYTTVIYQPYTYETWVAYPYTSVCYETKTVPAVTSSAYASVCTEQKVYPYTTAWVETQTTCNTVYPKETGGWGKGY